MGKEEIELIFRVIPLAIGAAFTPSLFGLQLVAAVSPRWASRTIATAIGAGLAFAIAISLLLFGFASLTADNRGQDSPLSGAIWLIVGIVLGASATWLFMPHPELAKSSEVRLTEGLNKAIGRGIGGVTRARHIVTPQQFRVQDVGTDMR